MDKTRTYSEEEIIALTLTIEHTEKSQSSFKWLMENNCIELAALCDVLVFNKTKAKEWLDKNQYISLSTFLDALDENEDDDSMEALVKGPHREWAAVVSIINEDDPKATYWLINSGLKYFAAFANILGSKLEEKNNRTSAVGGGIAVITALAKAALGGSSSAGITGFGGGSFGGAGAAGLW